MRKIEFKDGKHWPTFWSLINSLFLPRSKGAIMLKFTKDSKYTQPDSEEQKDWLKISGCKSIKQVTGPEGYKVSDREAILVWRYNIKKDLFEVGRHKRINGVRVPIKPEDIVSLREGQKHLFSMHFARGFGMLPAFPYFGGNVPEPMDGKSTIFYAE